MEHAIRGSMSATQLVRFGLAMRLLRAARARHEAAVARHGVCPTSLRAHADVVAAARLVRALQLGGI